MQIKKLSTVAMIRAALLGAIGSVLMQFELRLPIFPAFLALDISDLPALVGAITTGPLVGLLTSLIKNLLNPILFGTNTAGVGNFANFVIGTALVVPIGFIYQKHKNIIGYLIGSVIGMATMLIVAVIMNYFVLLPLYSELFIPMDRILEIANVVNSNVTDVFSLILFAIVPFNLLKGGLTIALGYAVFKALNLRSRT